MIRDDALGLSVNIAAPAFAKKGDNLPVVAWIYGGAFEVFVASLFIDFDIDNLISGSSTTYDGSVPVARSIELGKPMIYVSMNYR